MCLEDQRLSEKKNKKSPKKYLKKIKTCVLKSRDCTVVMQSKIENNKHAWHKIPSSGDC